jgi:hypothetical protein
VGGFDAGVEQPAFPDGVPVGAEGLADPAELADEGDFGGQVGVLHVLDDLCLARGALEVGLGRAEHRLEQVDEPSADRGFAAEDHERDVFHAGGPVRMRVAAFADVFR